MDVEQGCMDINECVVDDKEPCGSNQFCVNNEGSYSCLGVYLLHQLLF